MPNAPASGHAIEVLFDDGANVIVRKGPMFVQVRRGPMTIEAIELLAAIVRSARQTDAPMMGVLLVLEQSAPLPPADVRARQQALVRDLMRDGRVRAAAVIEGTGVEAMAKRSIGRL